MKTTCLVCGHGRFAVIRRKLRYGVKRDVLRCADCSFVFLRPLTKSQKKFYAIEYRKTYGPNLKKASTSRDIFRTYLPYQEEIILRIKPKLNRKMRVLEIGSSAGHFLTALKKYVGTRVGLELNKSDVAFIRRNLDFKVYDTPIETAKITEGPFDLVVSLQCLEHIEDPLSFLRAVRRQLKPNGYLYLELPNLHDALLDVYQVEGYADFYFREPHVSYFTTETLTKLLRRAGFTGTFGNVQRYNILNHLHWMMTGTPQSDFSIGNAPPVLANERDVPKNVRRDFNRFIQDVDREYKKMIERHALGESLTFLGTPTKR